MKYEQLKNSTYKKYKKIGKIHCPYLRMKVSFNSKGFWHMIYTGRNKKRDIRSQKPRFLLLEKAVKIVRLSATLQEYEEIKKQKVTYFGFIAIIENWKIKVIVKKIGNGKHFFWSVIPNWITNRKRDRVLFKGDLEKD